MRRPPSASEPRTPAQRDPGASPKGAGKASRIGQHAAAHLPLEEEAGACHAEKEEADAGAARCESQGPGRVPEVSGGGMLRPKNGHQARP